MVSRMVSTSRTVSVTVTALARPAFSLSAPRISPTMYLSFRAPLSLTFRGSVAAYHGMSVIVMRTGTSPGVGAKGLRALALAPAQPLERSTCVNDRAVTTMKPMRALIVGSRVSRCE